MTTNAKMSVVIPCFNARRYIGATVASVLAQDWAGLEVTVVDDGSSDGSAELVRATFPDVKLVRQANQGVAAARNRGIAESHGDWIAFVDADDIWLPGKLEAQWQLLQQEPAARMAYGAWRVWSSDEPVPPATLLSEVMAQAGETQRWVGPSGWIYPQLLLDCEVWTSTVLMQRSLLDEIGVFDPQLRIGEDYDLWLRASRVTPILRVPRPLALYRLHPTSITRSVPEANYRGVVVSRALAQWGYASPDGRSADKGDVDRALARTWSDYAGAQLQAGHTARARVAGLQAMRTDPWHGSGWKVLAKSLAQSLSGRRAAGR